MVINPWLAMPLSQLPQQRVQDLLLVNVGPVEVLIRSSLSLPNLYTGRAAKLETWVESTNLKKVYSMLQLCTFYLSPFLDSDSCQFLDTCFFFVLLVPHVCNQFDTFKTPVHRSGTRDALNTVQKLMTSPTGILNYYHQLTVGSFLPVDASIPSRPWFYLQHWGTIITLCTLPCLFRHGEGWASSVCKSAPANRSGIWIICFQQPCDLFSKVSSCAFPSMQGWSCFHCPNYFMKPHPVQILLMACQSLWTVCLRIFAMSEHGSASKAPSCTLLGQFSRLFESKRGCSQSYAWGPRVPDNKKDALGRLYCFVFFFLWQK